MAQLYRQRFSGVQGGFFEKPALPGAFRRTQGGALTARENVRPVGADFPQRYSPSESPRSRGPRKSRQTFWGGSDIFARCSRESVIVGYAL